MRYAAAAAALATAVACGGGDSGGDGGAAPSASQTTPAATQSTVVVTPEAKAVRDVVAKTLAACPCAVEVWTGSSDTGHLARLKGVYDPKTQTSELREERDGKPTGVLVRIIEGRTFVRAGGGEWLELDFSGLPKKAPTVHATLALADPRIAFAVASNVTVATETQDTPAGKLHDVEYDMATAVNATGPWADLMKRLVPEPSIYDKLFLKDGALFRVSFAASGSPDADDDRLDATLTVTRTGVAAPKVVEPPEARRVDVAMLEPGE